MTLFFGVCVFLFWRLRYPFALTYQEQLQLFLFDGDYLSERLAEPGGFARYIAEFLVQFYNSVTIGTLIITVLLMLVQYTMGTVLSVHSGVNRENRPHCALLSFIPAIMLWYAMGDESVLLTYVVALIFALLAILGWLRLRTCRAFVRWGVVAVAIPLLYWLIGPLVLLVAVCMMPLSMVVVAFVYAVACILASAWVLPYPLLRLVLGIGYYRFPETLPYVLMALPVIIALLYYVVPRLPKPKQWVVCAEALIVAALLLVPKSYGFDQRKYELIEYDYLVRIGDWQGVIAKAGQRMPDLPMSVSATNLALAMTNQLGERAFDFYQRGTQGLLPKFERNFATAQLTGEIYFHLGLINTAQRFAFEAMEAIPNYNKSARVVKRLAETNLINGQYAVARKYLKMLEKTVFYRPWAQRTMALLGDEKQINAHPLYGDLRQMQLKDDILFSDRELDKICGQLFVHNPQNLMAAQYLLLIPILEGDISRFVSYAQVVQNKTQYNPRAIQEAIAFAFLQQRQQPPKGLISPLILQQLNDFGRIYSADKNSPELARYRNTVWYYLTVGK